MTRTLASLLLAIIASCAGGNNNFAFAQTQTWIKVGGPWNAYSTTAPATIRFGYADSTGKNWITQQIPAGDFPSYPNGSDIPPAADNLPNPSSLGLEVDVLQSGSAFSVNEYDVWGGGGGGCFTTVTYSIPAAGAATTQQSDCPGQTTPPVTTPPVTTPPVTTPPVTTPPVTTPPVTTPPVTTPPVTTPPVTIPTPIGPITVTLPSATNLPMVCQSGLAAGTDSTGATAGQFFYIVCTQAPVATQ